MSKKDDDLKAMAEYIEQLKQQAKTDPQQAKIDANKALYESGVIDENGVIKNPIVTEG